MKRISKFIPLIVSLLAISCTSNSNEDKITPNKKAAYTLLVYMCGSNLESDYANSTNINMGGEYYHWNGKGLATLDLLEMATSPNKPDDVNIVIETGGAKKWTKNYYGKYGNYDISSKYLQIHHVNNKNMIELDKSMPIQNMGEASTLADFVEYGIKQYPAERTALILWNHGGGLQGVCFDELYDGDGLTAIEVQEAMETVFTNCNLEDKKLDWIGYDACLMGVQDIAEINSKYFNYMVSSQQLETGYGWYYKGWIDDLYEKKDTEVILQEVCDSFLKSTNAEYGVYANDQTMSYIDLSKIDEYKSAWEDLASKLNENVEYKDRNGFLKLVKNSKSFGDDYSYVYGLVDTLSFLNNLESSESFNPGGNYISRLKELHSQVVKYSVRGNNAGDSNGLSMYYPISSATFSYNSYTSKDTNFLQWSSLVNKLA